jgi:sec-independent protein translocase protein TatA
MGLGWMEAALIVGVLLVVFGPSKLPGLGKALGESIRGFKGELKGKKDERDVTKSLNESDKDDA